MAPQVKDMQGSQLVFHVKIDDQLCNGIKAHNQILQNCQAMSAFCL